MPLVEYGVAKFVLPGQGESGDHHLVCCNQGGILIAAIDGIGHGEEAANAAKAAVLPVAKGDTLVFVTDGIRGDFAEGVSALESPQRAADRILERHCRGTDDALVLVVRLTEVRA